jgi:hypothetical protein
LGGGNRPSADWRDYLEDIENRNGDDRHMTPRSQSADRDRIYGVAGAASGCAMNARVLIDNAPCGAPGNAILMTCQSAAKALSSCTCAGAAAALIKSPCTDQLGVLQCESALKQLRVCAL